MNIRVPPHICVFNVIVVLVGMAEAGGRPYLRSNLARTMYHRMVSDERLRNMDLSKLYEVDELALTDDVRRRFVQLSTDEETRQFLEHCFEQSEWLVTQIWHSIAKAFLGFFMTQTSVNGLLGRGRMFVWSEAQARQLLGRPRPDATPPGERKWPEDDPSYPADDREWTGEHRRPKGKTPAPGRRGGGGSSSSTCDHLGHAGDADGEHWLGERLLDLGAGDGYVTRILASGALQVDATEASSVMRRRLRERGYRVLDTWSWMEEVEDLHYDVVTCLNLLDRCDTPRTLLGHIHAKLAPHGTLVVAIVLPFNPYVETGTIDNLPSEELGVAGSTIEEQVNSLATDVFPALGYTLQRWSRLPYLCEGDLDQAFYWLSDVVLVFSKAGEGPVDVPEEENEAVADIASGLDRINVDL